MKHFLRVVILALIVCVTLTMVGCAKDMILDFANAVMTNIGDNVLTKSYELKGCRTFGPDTYTGTYRASYDRTTAKENLFGNTSIDRKEGDTVRLRAQMTSGSGHGALVLESGSSDPIILLDSPGTIDTEISIDPGSQYIVFECEQFTGDLDVEID